MTLDQLIRQVHEYAASEDLFRSLGAAEMARFCAQEAHAAADLAATLLLQAARRGETVTVGRA